ncbi:MAG: carboxymuconolactone decarboxylase family protein [Mycobacteriaceae bacterium]
MTNTERLNIYEVDPGATKAVLGLESYVRSGSLTPGLLDLIKIRASQLNGCAFCLDMHNRDAADRGESAQRLYVLSGWREAPQLFTERERAALAFTEAVTLIDRGGVPDDVWQAASGCFDDGELVQLLMAVATINVWNRLAVATHQHIPEQ